MLELCTPHQVILRNSIQSFFLYIFFNLTYFRRFLTNYPCVCLVCVGEGHIKRLAAEATQSQKLGLKLPGTKTIGFVAIDMKRSFSFIGDLTTDQQPE